MASFQQNSLKISFVLYPGRIFSSQISLNAPNTGGKKAIIKAIIKTKKNRF